MQINKKNDIEKVIQQLSVKHKQRERERERERERTVAFDRKP